MPNGSLEHININLPNLIVNCINRLGPLHMHSIFAIVIVTTVCMFDVTAYCLDQYGNDLLLASRSAQRYTYFISILIICLMPEKG